MPNVLVIGDTHCPAMLDGYVGFLLKMKKRWNCRKVIHIGDVVDWSSISYHEKNPAMPGAGDEYKKALKQVQKLYRAFPRAIVMTGNHDDLPARQARSSGIPPELLKSYSKIWETPNWDWRPRYASYTYEGVTYVHGDRGKGGLQAALKNAKENFTPWVQGHLHSQAGCSYFANQDSVVFGLSTGCGINYEAAAMDYGKRFSAKPVVGCGIVLGGHQAFFEPMPI